MNLSSNNLTSCLLQPGLTWPRNEQLYDDHQLQGVQAGLLEAAFDSLYFRSSAPCGFSNTAYMNTIDTLSSSGYTSGSFGSGDALGLDTQVSNQGFIGPSSDLTAAQGFNGLSSADPVVDMSPKTAMFPASYTLSNDALPALSAFLSLNEPFSSSSVLQPVPHTRSMLPMSTAAYHEPAVMHSAPGLQLPQMSLSPEAMYGVQSLAANIQPIFTTPANSQYVNDSESAFTPTPSSTPGRSNYNFLVYSPNMSPRTPFHDAPLPATCKWVTPPLPPLLDKVDMKELVETIHHLPMDDGHWSELLKASKPEVLFVLLENYLQHEDPDQWQARAVKNPNCRAVDNPRKYLTTNLKQKRDSLCRRPEVCTLVQNLKLVSPKAGKAIDGQSIQHICDHIKTPLAIQACGGYLAQALQADSCWDTGKKPKAVVLAKVKQFVSFVKEQSRSSSSSAVMEDRALTFNMLVQACRLR